MESLLQALDDHFNVVLAFLIGGGIAIVSITKTVAGLFLSLAKERSRREIAAYIAEGTISAKDGERLLRADVNLQADEAC
jgi:hypothetical protein